MEFGEWNLVVSSLNCFSLLQEFKRVLVPGGPMVIFYDNFKIGDISIVAEQLKLKQLRIGIWEKTNSVPIGTKRTLNSYYDRASYEAPIVSGKVRFHPCQKPVAVLEKKIATHSNKGETVLDCFMGSKST
ncbi:hypothetical protein J7J00_02025 [Bacillus sp. ISL-4]|uniref:DNA methyltransferase n=1 Tax=Bacillus sp. ISL-4 TaxID=2819125 RepID=UPI001BE69E1D|nr:DNA methyltransferase [Bacillus sp. ISL-4]MBT2664288.1 hypothetical protein [Bacillus sp. ISL-4]MBT2669313.1 hypothetical protein [Streptomyces sp. ISL-14]